MIAGVDRLSSLSDKEHAAHRESLITGLHGGLNNFASQRTKASIGRLIDGLMQADNPRKPDWIGLTRHTDDNDRLRHALYVHEIAFLRTAPMNLPDAGELLPEAPGIHETKLVHKVRSTLRNTTLDHYIIDSEEGEFDAHQFVEDFGAHDIEVVWSSSI